MPDSAATSTPAPTSADVAERIFAAGLGAMETLSMFIGDQLGWYRALATAPRTPAELAAATSTDERYAREWLEHQAVIGVLDVEAADEAGERRYHLDDAAAVAFTDQSSTDYLIPLARMIAASAMQLPALLQAYRVGGGVSWDELGDHARWSQADMNRPWFERQLAPALAGVADLHAHLARPGARIVDVGCGAGWSAIALARAYPDAVVHGVDIDAPSIEQARRNAAEAGVDGRVEFVLGDGRHIGGGGFDAAFAFECVHDMPRPVEVLEAIREAVSADGHVVIMDEAVAHEFTAPGDELERVMYGFSLLVCLPDSRSSAPSAATGTVMRPSTLDRYAREAGFSGAEVLPIDDFGFWRFYRLTR